MYSKPVSEPAVVPPPPDVKLIIDKMADYVARNGPEFEIVVRRRNDERFRFVDADHPHHAYYLHKKDAFLRVSNCISSSSVSTRGRAAAESNDSA